MLRTWATVVVTCATTACGSGSSSQQADGGADAALDAAIDAAIPCVADSLVGAGTAEDPYRVCASTHLEMIRDDDGLLSAHFVVTHDFDASSFTGQLGATGPTALTGTFDGADHEIVGLTLSSATGEGGLFRTIGEGGTVKSLRLTSVDVELLGLSSGALVGTNMGTISHVSVSGAVTGGSFAGMLCGTNSGSIVGSSSEGTLEGGNHVGGLAGTNDGSISESWSTAVVTANNRVGGLVGSAAGSVERSFAVGAVTASLYGGGLVGSLFDGRISNSYARGDIVTGESSGGLVGDFQGTIEYSYAAKIVVGNSAGGLTSTTVVLGSVVTDSYWDTSLYLTSPVGTGRSHAEMEQKTSFPAFDFDTVWVMSAALSGYPSLLWQLQ